MGIEEVVGDAKTLEVALKRVTAARPPWKVVDVVVQDEYSHDVILGTKEGRWAVLDAT
jgi:hypothetical protein